MNTELRLVHNISSSNKHGQSAKDYRFTEHEINMIQELNIAKQGTE